MRADYHCEAGCLTFRSARSRLPFRTSDRNSRRTRRRRSSGCTSALLQLEQRLEAEPTVNPMA